MLGATLGGLHVQFAELLSRNWQLSDQIVLNRLDSDSVLSPWLRAARACGVSVKWAEFDLETGEVPTWQYEHLITPQTRLVTVPLGNPATGTIPDVRAIADLAHDVGALVLVDVGAATPHLPLSLDEFGADLMTVEAATLRRPDDVGAHRPSRPAVGRRRGLALAGAASDSTSVRWRSSCSTARPPRSTTSPGWTTRQAAPGASGCNARSTISGAHTARLWKHFDARVAELPHVTVFGGSGPRLPVLGFTVARRTPAQVGEFLARRGVSVWTGPSGMSQLLTAFGADEIGGAAFAGFMPHTTVGEVDQLLAGLAELG